jgi:hypothetical protein
MHSSSGFQYAGLVVSLIIFKGYFVAWPTKPKVSLKVSVNFLVVVSSNGSFISLFEKHSSQTLTFSLIDHHGIILRFELHLSQKPFPHPLKQIYIEKLKISKNIN